MNRNLKKIVVKRALGVRMAAFMLCFGTVASAAWALGTRSSTGSVIGVVCDSAGVPQMGIAVELLRADSSPVSRVFTDQKGGYRIASVLPGQYAIRAAGTSFIPTLKQNLRVRANTIVNLTLSNLYDLMQIATLPSRPRVENADDWAWTLRSAASRPLLRWLDDGSPIVVYDGAAETTSAAQRESCSSAQRRRTRVLASAGGKQFGIGPSQLSYTMVREISSRRSMAIGAAADPDAESSQAGGMDAMFGFRQQITNSGLGSSSVQTLGAVMSDAQASAGQLKGMEAISLRNWESLELLNHLHAEAGSDQLMAHIGDGSLVMSALPFASLTLDQGQSTFEYRVATSRAGSSAGGQADAASWLPILSERQGALTLEHGLHQEVGWSTVAGPAEVQLVIYADSVENPMIEGSGRVSASDTAGPSLLIDRASGVFRTAGPNYSTTGVLATVESRLPGDNRIKLSYASGDALVMHANAVPQSIAVILDGIVARRAQMYSIALSGTAEGTGTRWRASYRWQPGATVTEVAPFAIDANDPYLNVSVRQPLWNNRNNHNNHEASTAGVEAQLNLRNLLAEGYQPFLTRDGSQLYFAQAQRCVRGGLAFTF